MVSADLPIEDATDYGIKLLEEERRRISRDLHDGPAQALTNISMRVDILSKMMQSNPELAAQELVRMNSRIVSVINDIRRLIYDLRPVAIDEAGLFVATTELCRRVEKDWRLTVSVQVPPDLSCTLAPAKQVALYRLIQEILNNVHKHAQATVIEVAFQGMDGGLQVSIKDDGQGFNPDYIPEGHYGLIGMKERAQFLGGNLSISSELGRGSEFVIVVPMPANVRTVASQPQDAAAVRPL